jgi:hypothetical protein
MSAPPNSGIIRKRGNQIFGANRRLAMGNLFSPIPSANLVGIDEENLRRPERVSHPSNFRRTKNMPYANGDIADACLTSRPKDSLLSPKLHQKTFDLGLGALGVVYGDLCTYPLYAVHKCFYGPHAVQLNDSGDVAKCSQSAGYFCIPANRVIELWTQIRL